MTQNTSSSSSHQYDGIRVQSLRKRRYYQNTPKIISPHESSTVLQQNELQSSKTIEHSKRLFSTKSPTNENQPQTTCDPRWRWILKVLYGILGILLLTALILPSIFIYLLMPKSTNNQSGLSEQISIYTDHCTGISSKSLWEMNTTSSITMNFNTSQCNFTETPLYFVSVGGSGAHYCLTGYGAIYEPTNTSFQIYASSTCGGWTATTMLSLALTYGWDVNWIGFYKY